MTALLLAAAVLAGYVAVITGLAFVGIVVDRIGPRWLG